MNKTGSTTSVDTRSDIASGNILPTATHDCNDAIRSLQGTEDSFCSYKIAGAATFWKSSKELVLHGFFW